MVIVPTTVAFTVTLYVVFAAAPLIATCNMFFGALYLALPVTPVAPVKDAVNSTWENDPDTSPTVMGVPLWIVAPDTLMVVLPFPEASVVSVPTLVSPTPTSSVELAAAPFT